MTKPRSLSPALLVKAGVEVAKGTPRRKILAQHPALPERLVRELQRAKLGQSEYRERLQQEFQAAAREAVASFRADLRAGKVPPGSKAIAAGIFTDKAAVLAGRTAMETVDVASMVAWTGPKSREELIRSLSGEQDRPPLLAPSLGTA